MNYKNSIFLLLFLGAFSISATPPGSTEGKTELIMGKWVSYKIVESGKNKHISTEHKAMWMQFEENSRMTAGVNDEEGTQAEWAIEEEQKKLYITAEGEQVEYKIIKLTSSALILQRQNDPNKTKIYFNRSSE
jgi:hypothetical protein